MGNVLRCLEGEDDRAGGDHYPYYRPTSRPHYQPPQYYSHDQPPAAPPPRPHQQAQGPHGATAVTAGVDTVDQYTLNFKSTSMLRGVRFIGKRFSIQRVRDDYRHLSRVLQLLIRTSGGDITKLPPDYKEFLELLESNNLTMKDEFLIVNNSALLPMSNRTEVFLMLYDRIVMYLGRTKAGKAKKKRILSKLPYNNDWLDTASANKQINQWVVNKTQKQYERTQLDQLRLNRNVRSHLHQYNDDNIEEIMYCEWPELLMDMVKMLHMEGELQGTDIQNKFG